MKKLIRICAAFLLMAAFVVPAQGQTVENRQVSSFSAIQVSSAIHVVLKKADKEALTLETNKDVMDQIITKVKGGVLHISTKGELRNITIKAYIDYVALEKIGMSGATRLESLNPIVSRSLKIDCSGASKVELEVEVEDFEVSASGASKINLSGTANNHKLDVSGATKYMAMDLKSQKVDLHATGASKVEIFASESLNSKASGASKLSYGGQPGKTNINSSGGSKVTSVD